MAFDGEGKSSHAGISDLHGVWGFDIILVIYSMYNRYWGM